LAYESGLKILYIDTYTLAAQEGGVPSSDAIGYGLTSSQAIQRELVRRGVHVTFIGGASDCSGRSSRHRRVRWIAERYAEISDTLAASPPDLIFLFHAFTVFPAEIRRILLDLGLSIPMVGYTHGSHWDPTDTFRFDRYPGLEILDLANLHSLDRVLVVSKYMRDTLVRSLQDFNAGLGESITAKIRVVGLPIDIELIERYRTAERSARPTVVFNHAPISSKNPSLFVRVMDSVMRRYPINVLFTRRFSKGDPGEEAVQALAQRFRERVVLGNDMSVPDYYCALWRSDLQVSTATHESLGIATLEAMCTENCCILPRLGSYPEICEQHPDVLYGYGEEQLETRICYFLEHPRHRERVAAELARMAKRYEPARVMDDILAVFAEFSELTKLTESTANTKPNP
jgi:hypothetical protein